MKIVGGLVDKIRSQSAIQQRHFNPYLNMAAHLSEILFTQQELKLNPDILKTRHPKDNLLVEIGCYFGKTLVELAFCNPSMHTLGVDITYKRVVKTALRIQKHQLSNASVALCDGLFLFKEILTDESLKGLCVFFPDPWLKLRQEKNRLLNEEFIELASRKIQKGGFFWLKTDQESYFLNTQFLLLKKGFILSECIYPNTLNEASYTTEFQNLFTKKNTPFFAGVYYKS